MSLVEFDDSDGNPVLVESSKVHGVSISAINKEKVIHTEGHVNFLVVDPFDSIKTRINDANREDKL